MSASAIKSTMPGVVGTSTPSSGHTMLPMTAMAQKVSPGADSTASMKPLSTSGLSYVTLQPASQPLSLVQDHRSPVYPPYSSNNGDNKPEPDKSLPNGVEMKPQEQETPPKQTEVNRNNNLSPENSTVEPEGKNPGDSPAEHQSKPEEKKSPLNNGSKDPETPQSQKTPQKEEPSPQNVQKKTPTKTDISPTAAKSDMKIATTPRVVKRKSRELKDLKGNAGEGGSKPKRNRVQTQPYQSPLPEIALIVKTLSKPVANKNADDKLIVFYKNEFLAVRNAEGSFYVCQAMQNIYKSSRRIRIRWLSQDKNNGEIYSPDFYDFTDFDCILTNLNLNKIDKNKFQLTKIELLRTENILKRAIDVEAGVSEKPSVTEEHPDGLDLSLYKDESQLKKRKGNSKGKQRQRKISKRDETSSSSEDESSDEDEKKSRNSRNKKRITNKALAIAKSVAKVPSRAKRALNRANKSPVINNVEEKRNDSKKVEMKKTSKQGSTANRTKLRGSGESTEVERNDKTSTGRAKRMATTTSTITNAEDSTSRIKKSRGRA
ncbi:neurofilament heavy polypeptide [Fopius arisanus]|uniref:Neurofilament heavy polypeptide n=1 Tax=Fopius arisanus TaxID=64838 RepID=A0A0C9QZF0_9HYME|nr:PREDICTED: neurofilament heavy polypeptide-like [Fopius arisanus]